MGTKKLKLLFISFTAFLFIALPLWAEKTEWARNGAGVGWVNLPDLSPNYSSDENLRAAPLSSSEISGTEVFTYAPEYVPDEIIVKFKPKIKTAVKEEKIRVLNKKFGTKLKKRINKIEAYVLKTAKGASIPDLIKAYKKDPDIEYAEPNYISYFNYIPDDSSFSQQWALHNTGQTGGTFDADIDAPEAWDLEIGSPGVIIAVIDSGIDWNHPDLVANIWLNNAEVSGTTGVDDDGNGYIDDTIGWDFVTASSSDVYPGEDPGPADNDPMDFNGHGTFCSGIAAAVTNNSIGVAGVSWDSKIMGVRAGYSNTSGNGVLRHSDIAPAIVYATDNGAHVISMSFGGSESETLKTAIDYAYSHGVILVAAAGNDNASWKEYPAGYDNVIAVSATDHNDAKAWFSNYGSWIDIAAPGVSIYSTWFDDTYTSASGTSASAPFVSGLAALILSHNPAFSHDEVRQVLRTSTDDIIDAGWDIYSGYGRINAYNALQVNSVCVADITSPLVYDTVKGTINIMGKAKGSNFYSYKLEYGEGTAPLSWTQIGATSYVQVSDGLLGAWDATNLADGQYTVRLTVTDTFGGIFEDRTYITLQNVETRITKPLETSVLRYPAGIIAFEGKITAAGFQNYTIEWGVGESPSSWSNAGITLENGGTQEVIYGPLGSWDTTVLPFEGHYRFRVIITYGSGLQKIEEHKIYFDSSIQEGWPQTERNITQITSADIDNDGDLEILAGGNLFDAPGTIHAWHHNGIPIEGWPIEYYGGNFTGPFAVGDVDNNGLPEIVSGYNWWEDNKVFIYRNDGVLMENWPQPGAKAYPFESFPVLADIDNDLDLEIFVGGGELFAWHHDGTTVSGWPKDMQGSSPAVADVNQDGYIELILVSMDKLYVFDHFGNVLPGFPITLEDLTYRTPTLGDIDNDGQIEIVLTVTNTEKVYAFELDGTVMPGWPVTGGSSNIVLGDVDGNGDLEIFMTEGRNPIVYAWHHDGTSLAGWPISVPFYWIRNVEPILGDVNGDGNIDVIISGEMSGENYEKIYAYNSNGTIIDGWPKLLRYIPGYGIMSSPVIGDIDKDGYVEIAVSSQSWQAYAIYSDEYKEYAYTDVYIWNIPFPYNNNKIEWGMYGSDQHHTRTYGDWIPPVAVANPAGGTYGASQSVSLIANESATIFYTTDGSIPTTSSPVYLAPINILTTTTLKFFAVDLAGNYGAIKTEIYTIISDTTPPEGSITINSGATYTNSTSVNLTLSCSDTGGNCTQMQFSNDNINWSTPEDYTTSKIWTLISGDGTKSVYVKFKDNAGNWSDFYSDTIILDSIVPITTALPTGGTYTSAQNVILTCNDSSGSGCANTLYCLGSDCIPSIPYSGAVNISNSNSLRFYSTDNAGNSETVKTEVYTINIDTTPPTGTININSGATYTISTSVNLTLSCTDIGGSCTQMQFSNDNITYSTPEDYTTSKIWTLTSDDGTKSVYVKFKDNAGNWSDSYSDTIILDTIASATTASPTGGTYTSAQNVILTCNDGSGSGCANTLYCLSSGCTPSTPYSGEINISISNSLRFYSTDNAGNSETVKTEVYTINIDTIPPTGSANINSGATYANSTSINLTLSCDDGGGSGCSQMQFSNDNITYSTPEAYVTAKAWNLVSGDGTKTVYAKFKDNDGNWSSAYSDTIILDITTPATTSSPVGGIYSSEQDVTLTCNDGTGSGCDKIYYTTDGSTPTTSSLVYSSPINVMTTTTLKFFAEDFAGNHESVKTEVYNIDTTLPIGTIDINSEAIYTNSTSVTLTLSCTDTGGSCTQMQISNDNSNWSTPEAYGTTKTWTLTSGDGSKTVYVKFKDNVGNWSDSFSDTIILDTIGPTTTASPVGGTYSSEQDVTLTCNDGSGSGCTSTLYCIGSGCTPTTPYSGAINISSSSTLRFYSTDNAGNSETVKTEIYTINIDTTPPVTSLSSDPSSPDGNNGWFKTTPSITLTRNEPGTTYYSWTSSSGPWTTYSAPFSSPTGGHILYYYSVDAFNNTEAVKSQPFNVDTIAPTTTALPVGGIYSSAQDVTLTCNDGTGSGCDKVYYTTDGSTPTTSSPVYSSPISITTSTTLNFLAVDLAGNQESVKTETYTINPSSCSVITVISPNEADVIPSGSLYTINWCAPPEAVSFKLHYSKDNGLTWILIAKNITGTSYDWQIPVLFNNQKYCRVRVKAFNSQGVEIGKDKSDSVFTIEIVKLTSPDGGETLTSGTLHTITWITNVTKYPVASAKLVYTTNGGATWTLIDTPSGNPGSYNWTVPNVSSSSCKVKVVLKDTSGTAVGKDASDGFFTIQQ